MRDYHKNPLLSWRPPGELSSWARGEAERRGQRIGDFLSSLLIAERERTPVIHVLAAGVEDSSDKEARDE